MGSLVGATLLDLARLFLPRHCAVCSRPLTGPERAFCLHCAADLPLARFHGDPHNPVERLFHGRIRLHAASAFLRFNSGGMVQRLLHALKYGGNEEVGLELGARMARDAMRNPRFQDVDLALPIPLHPRRERQRGYNQSMLLVEGMREHWPLPLPGKDLLRIARTTTQTRKGRLARWLNVEQAFVAAPRTDLAGAHVLIVDDVVTTGATVEACARTLAQVPDIRISVLTCACA